MWVRYTSVSPMASSSSAAVSVTSCGTRQFPGMKVRSAGAGVTSVPSQPPTVTLTGPVGSLCSATV